MNILKSTPVILLGTILVAFLVFPFLSPFMLQIFYTASELFKSILTLLLPIIIFSFVLSGLRSFKKGAPLVLGVLVGSIMVSNALVALVTYALARLFAPLIFCKNSSFSEISVNALEPLFRLPIPQWIGSISVYALVAAISVGIYLSVFEKKTPWLFKQLEKGVKLFLSWILIPLLPLYVFGFMLKLLADGSLGILITNYTLVCAAIVALQFLFLVLWYVVAAQGSFTCASTYIVNALPSYLTALTTMSSTVTVPVSVESAEKNTHNRALANVAMPIMANIHLLGDAVLTPMLMIATMILFGSCIPSFYSFLVFIPYFCVAMLGAAGVPGGGILVMLPLLKSHFGFTPSMLNVVISLYLLMDPLGTSANVMGDGALVIIVNTLLRKLGMVSTPDDD